jgi:orotidine 5'-phosphate decarboxylase subfamily 1
MKNKLIIAIDKNDFNEAFNLCNEIKNEAGYFKLGLEFFYSFGAEGVNKIANLGVPIFLDLKLHDIPNTVAKACFTLLNSVNGVEMLTLHASGGEKMLKDANLEMLKISKKKPMVFGVTVLTSTSEVDVWEGKRVTFPFAMVVMRAFNKLAKTNDGAVKKLIIAKLKNMVNVANNSLLYWKNLYKAEEERIIEANKLLSSIDLALKCNAGSEEFYRKNILGGGILNTVLHLSSISFNAGIEGIVCSSLEVGDVKAFFPSLKVITPGIRPKWYEEKDDQARILTPKEAISKGADFLVIGRPITKSSNPKEALQKTLLEMES